MKSIDVQPPDRRSNAEDASSAGNDVGPPPVPTLAGHQQLVRGWPLRGKFRNSFEHPEPFEPGVVEAVTFSMPDVNHVFRRGHRIMVQLQSTWFPLIDRNPQVFVELPAAAPHEYQKATQRLMRSRTQPFGVEIHVVRTT